MENDGNLSDTDLIYVGEEHIDLDDPTIQATGVDDLLMARIQEEQMCDDDIEVNDGELENDGYDERNSYDTNFLNESRDDKDLSGGKVEGLMIVDEWDDEDLNSDEEKEDFVDKDAINPEDVEKAMLSLPTMKVLMDDIGHLKQNRKVIVSPVSIDDFNALQIQDILAWTAMEEAKFNFTKSCKDANVLIGILVLHFTTSGSANMAVETLKAWKENLDIKVESNSNKIVEDFVSDTRGKKRWTDNVAILKNLADDVKVETIRELFPQAEDVILHLEPSKQKEIGSSTSRDPVSGTGTGSAAPASTPRGYAYLVFPSDEIANSEVVECAAKKPEISGHKLILLNYRNPVNAVPRCYLRLRERKVLMRHLDKCVKMIEKNKQDPLVKLPERVEERVEVCTSLIEKDNKCRKEMELPEPTVEELKRMPGLPTLDSASCQKILVRFGIIKEKRKKTPTPLSEKRKERVSHFHKTNYNNKRNIINRRVSPIRGGRRSPYSNNRRSRGSDMYRSSRNTGGRNIPPSLLGGATSLMNPLALMMQQNMGMIGTGGVLNPALMVQPNVNMMGGAHNMLASQGLSYSGMGGSMDDVKSKMIRLDETGNFRATDDPRNQSSRYDNRMRRGMDDSRDRDLMRRKRSPSPLSRSRQDYDMPSGKRSALIDGVPAPVNLLLNLSHMLSQNMEQKRHDLDKGKRLPYNRDYRGNQR